VELGLGAEGTVVPTSRPGPGRCVIPLVLLLCWPWCAESVKLFERCFWAEVSSSLAVSELQLVA